MTTDDQVAVVAKFGFTDRQARFLVTVLRHGGVCVPRQYATFAGTAYGRRVNEFFDRLVGDGFAVRCGCLHNRARVYHVQHRPLYGAIGQPESRYRRPVAAGRIIERLIRLDAVLGNPDLDWLVTADEKLDYFTRAVPSLSRERLPHSPTQTGASNRPRLFPDDVPTGVEATGRVVFLYVAIDPFADEFRAFLQRHVDLLRGLPHWTLRLVIPQGVEVLRQAYEAAVRDEFAPMPASVIPVLRWYFEQRRLAAEHPGAAVFDRRFRQAQQRFFGPRFRALHRRWITEGDAVFDVNSTGAIREALERRAAHVDTQILPFSYRHLSPLVCLDRTSVGGVEEGEETREEEPARPQPPTAASLEDPTQAGRDWHRLMAARNA